MLVLSIDACTPGPQADFVATPAHQVRDSAQLAQPHDPRLDELLTRNPVPDVVAHRVRDSGTRPSVVDDDLRRALGRLSDSGDQPMPESLALLDLLRERLPRVPQVACPDAALPHRGHGLSIGWARRRAAEFLGRAPEELNLVIVHAGEDWSVCATRGGVCVDDARTSGSPRAPMDTEDGYVTGLRHDIATAVDKIGAPDAVVFTGELGWARDDLPATVCAGLAVPVHLPVHTIRPRPELELAELARGVAADRPGPANPRRVRLDDEGKAHT